MHLHLNWGGGVRKENRYKECPQKNHTCSLCATAHILFITMRWDISLKSWNMLHFKETITWPMDQPWKSSQSPSPPSKHLTTAFFLRHYVYKFTGFKNLIIYARNAGKNVEGWESPFGHFTNYTQQTSWKGQIKYLAEKVDDVISTLLWVSSFHLL